MINHSNQIAFLLFPIRLDKRRLNNWQVTCCIRNSQIEKCALFGITLSRVTWFGFLVLRIVIPSSSLDGGSLTCHFEYIFTVCTHNSPVFAFYVVVFVVVAALARRFSGRVGVTCGLHQLMQIPRHCACQTRSLSIQRTKAHALSLATSPFPSSTSFSCPPTQPPLDWSTHTHTLLHFAHFVGSQGLTFCREFQSKLIVSDVVSFPSFFD